jgi:hypothetical protein
MGSLFSLITTVFLQNPVQFRNNQGCGSSRRYYALFIICMSGSRNIRKDAETSRTTFALNRGNKVPHASSRCAVSPEKLFHGTAAPGFISMHDCFPAAASGNELNCCLHMHAATRPFADKFNITFSSHNQHRERQS